MPKMHYVRKRHAFYAALILHFAKFLTISVWRLRYSNYIKILRDLVQFERITE